MGWLDGDVAIVTGGGSGIGRAVARRYVEEGCRVVVADVSADRLAQVQAELGDRVATIVCDVRDHRQNAAVVRKAVETFGKLDIFVANAGMGDKFTELADLPADQVDAAFAQIFEVNVKGIIHGAKAALPELLKTRGAIVVTLSNSSFYPDGGGVMYIASKHAALGVVRQLAHEFAPLVRVNAVAPGATRTNITSPAAFGEATAGPQVGGDAAARAAAIAETMPLKTFPEADAHAAAYVLVASRTQAPMMTGTVIESDGGLGVRGLRRVRGGEDLARRVLGTDR
ncbi:SDR family NAD(P)-dependent oxidoreductase [Amycolatopsis rhabdoformis]|uniref:SDR family NAD(P)-dependent oxidoreductase n=1 Tax=Amycolatopsis rhabdoformis TaxID=1448059 RepID=A0ABZ1IJ17_9PSEU|nr:SDR family NAD(P)-dependent oxidoreductase [Amycolatopsis rhabdoformis]WSE33544.1 SDR family NAD(P)-dependent oxidoreductase [Amycolatopsis rhabdoformis]